MHVFWEWKNSCSSKFVQLELLDKAKAKSSKNRAAQGFHYINSCISNFLDPIQKRALSRSVQLEAVYLEALLYTVFIIQILKSYKILLELTVRPQDTRPQAARTLTMHVFE